MNRRAVQQISICQPGFHARRPIDARPLLIVGADSTLGHVFTQLCALRGLRYEAFLHSANDSADAVKDAIHHHWPWAVVDVSHCPKEDEGERELQLCFPENTFGPALLVHVCACLGIQILTFSPALAFDRKKSRPYVESDKVGPRNGYDGSKAAAEQKSLKCLPSACMVHTGVFYGPWDEYHFVTKNLQTLGDGRSFVAVLEDATLSPTHVSVMVHELLDLLIDGESGLSPLVNVGDAIGIELARCAAPSMATGMEGCQVG